MGNHLNTPGGGINCSRPVFGIDITGQPDPRAISPLHQIKHNGPVTGLGHAGKFSQMLRTPLGHAIGKLRPVVIAAQMHVFDLDIGIRQPRRAGQKVDPASLAIGNFGPDIAITRERWDGARQKRLFHHPVGHAGIDTGHMAIFQLGQSPTELELLFGIIVGFKPNLQTRAVEPQHRAGVRAMGRNLASVFQRHVRQKPLVATDQPTGNKGGWKPHGPRPIPKRLTRQGAPMANPSAAMLVIGDEILSGRTRDANIHHLAGRLTEMGIDLKEVRVVSDDAPAIVAAVRALSKAFAYVFTSGGIGPTHDDITADCVAEALGAHIDVREDARALLQAHYDKQGTELNAARLRMARIPDGATLIDNPVSIAPGFSLQNVHVMAGVPQIFQAMIESLLPTLTGGAPLLSETLKVSLPEGEIAGPLGQIATSFPNLSFGSYPFNKDGLLGANVVVRGTQATEIADALAALSKAFGASAA